MRAALDSFVWFVLKAAIYAFRRALYATNARGSLKLNPSIPPILAGQAIRRAFNAAKSAGACKVPKCS